MEGKGGVPQAADDAQVQRQIAVGALAHVQGALHRAQHVGILQVSAQEGQRQRHRAEQHQQPPVRRVKAPPGAFVPGEKVYAQHRRAQGKQRQHVGLYGKGEKEGQQRGQPHHQQDAQGAAQPQAAEKALGGQQIPDDAHAAQQINRKIQDAQHGGSPFGGFCSLYPEWGQKANAEGQDSQICQKII